MLKKVYRELMILGLLSFIIKMLTEVGGMDTYDDLVLALQVADLIIFILAIMLIIQAIIVLILLRRHNKRVDLAELVSTADMVEVMSMPDKTTMTSRGKQLSPDLFQDNAVKHRILRHLFIRRFGLPYLFPVSKYLRRAQVNNIVHTIEVEPSMWLLVLAMSWAFTGVIQILEEHKFNLRYDLIVALMAFAWLLVLTNVCVMLYFHHCVNRLLAIGGYSTSETVLLGNLSRLAEEEATAWESEAADDVLDTLNRLHAYHEDIENEREAEKHGILKGDAGFELIASCFRNMVGGFKSKERRGQQTGVEPDSPGAVYSFDDIYDEVGIFPVIAIPLPLIMNAFVFQKCIFRDFVLVSTIIRMDASVLGEVVNHFSEIVELRSEFATVLLQCMKEHRRSIAGLEKALKSQDLRHTGLIDVNKLRTVLASFGFRLTRFKFSSVIKLMFDLRGTSVEYAQLIQLVSLMQQEFGMADDIPGQTFGMQRTVTSCEDLDGLRLNRQPTLPVSRRFPLLAQSSRGPEPGPNDFVCANSPSLRQLQIGDGMEDTSSRRSVVERGYAALLTSSRALHSLYTLRKMSFVVPESSSNSSNSTR
ncbi:unnamed protein product [Peronospora belbahrii]|uniref:EF-hand domain-containing protein n=1 Tax=Peronospora belbahrii TaxID=622444 RepID=A0ABN8CT77_9STRA|nr:unnamed protein product [Peronospora belbahrii]